MEAFEKYLLQEQLRSAVAEEPRRRRRHKRINLTGKLWFRLSVVVWAAVVLGVLLSSGKAEAAEPDTRPIPALVIQEPVIGDEHMAALIPEPSWFREDVPMEREVQKALYEACTETGLRYELMLALVRKETDYRNLMGDGGESYGYCQVQPRWHKERMERLGVTDLMDPAGNFRVACDYLAELLERYELPQALTAYNSGKPGESEYARAVMGYMEELECTI